MRSPGFLSLLQTQLESLPLEVLKSINQPGGLEIPDIINYILRPSDHTVYDPDNVNVVDNVTSHSRCPMTSRVCMCLTIKSLDDVPTVKRILRAHENAVFCLVVPHDLIELCEETKWERDLTVIPRNITLGLTPDNRLAEQRDGSPFLLTCGSGDAAASITTSGLLDQFIESAGRCVVFVDVSNYDESIDISQLVKAHVASGKPITCSVTARKSSAVENVLCNHDGVDQIIECHRLSSSRPSQYTWTSSGIMVVDVKLVDLPAVRWNWHRVKRNIEGQLVVQFERSLFDLTSTYQTQYISADETKA